MNKAVTPVVGMGATLYVGSDRYPYTIIKVSRTRITLQRDNADYTPNTTSTLKQASLRSNGKWVKVGYDKHHSSYFVLGMREFYMDPCF